MIHLDENSKNYIKREDAIRILGENLVDKAESFYETDYDKYFWNDLYDQEKYSYFCKVDSEKARKLLKELNIKFVSEFDGFDFDEYNS